MSRFRNILIIIACLGLTTSCDKPNVLTQLSATSTDEAYFIDAQKEVDASNWDGAITIIETKMSAAYAANRSVVNLHASAYAGKCGVSFLTLVNGLKNATASASQIFPYFLSAFAGINVLPGACESAIVLLQSIGPYASRTTDENLFLALLGVARIATNMAAEIDSADHNGTIDASSNICHEWSGGNPLHVWVQATDPIQFAAYPPPSPQPAHFMTDSEIGRLAAGLGLLIENAAALSSVIGNSNSVITAVSSVQTQCQTANSGTACTFTTDPAAVSNQMLYIFRGLLDSSAMGFGSCVPGSATIGQICCPTVKPPPANGVWP